jgi:hypothetical protein
VRLCQAALKQQKHSLEGLSGLVLLMILGAPAKAPAIGWRDWPSFGSAVTCRGKCLYKCWEVCISTGNLNRSALLCNVSPLVQATCDPG